jgi:putative membrane protein
VDRASDAFPASPARALTRINATEKFAAILASCATPLTARENVMMGNGFGGWGGMGFGSLWMWIFWIVLIAGVVLLVRWMSRGAGSVGPPAESALDVLKRRYASGEIGREEFEQKKRDLQSGSP